MAPTSLTAKLWAALAGLYLIAWLPVRVDQIWFEQLGTRVHWAVALGALPLGILWLAWAAWSVRRMNVAVAFFASVLYVTWWQLAIVAAHWMVWDTLRANLARYGLVGLFLLGLAWVVWFVDRATRRHEAQRRAAGNSADARLDRPAAMYRRADRATDRRRRTIWNPLDPRAWYYGRRAGKLNQSVMTFMYYSLTFGLVALALSRIRGCEEIYEMPAGGGQQMALAQTVRVKTIKRKKFVVNPYSAILFNPPPIDDVQLSLTEATEHAYTVGYGEGAGAGFGGGTARGKVRLIRLEYTGGNWDQNFGIGGDDNMLREYGIRTRHKVADKTESRRIIQLRNFPVGKSPPLVYMTGQQNISLTNTEVKILRDFLTTKHGMLFGDNCGSRHFHNQFVAMMNRVLPGIRPVTIPLDDAIHKVPYPIAFFPYASPHGGREALGWWKDGRWLCYYHPGDIGDAWRDDHAGVRAEIWEACYQLGTNIIFYAHTEYSKWLAAQKKSI
ncbi:MAG: DUF4159 domain-containing protein [Planctomycetes bacterium]|nr:DUF4159 domain-containing protein [Planctomycetota bacterium]